MTSTTRYARRWNYLGNRRRPRRLKHRKAQPPLSLRDISPKYRRARDLGEKPRNKLGHVLGEVPGFGGRFESKVAVKSFPYGVLYTVNAFRFLLFFLYDGLRGSDWVGPSRNR